MKPITAAVGAKILTRQDIEPITLIKIELGGTIGTLYYGDREVVIGSQKWLGKTVTIGTISAVRNQTSGSFNSISITLDDSDLHLYNQLNSIRFCTKKVTVYEYFAGLSSSDLVTLLVGELSTPISWKEADRTLSFEINTKVRSLQAGYAPLNTLLVQQDIIGKAMPLCYGTVFDIPCQVLIKPRQAKLFDDVLFNDSSPFIIGTKTFRVDQNLYWADNVQITLVLGTLKVSGHFVGTTFYMDEKKIEHLVYQGFDYTDSHKIYVTLTTLNVTGQRIQLTQPTEFGGPSYFQERYTVLMQTSVVVNGVKVTELILDNPITQTAASIDDGLKSPLPDVLVLPTLTWTVFKAGTIVYQDGFTTTTLCCNAIPSTTILQVQAYKSTTLTVGSNSRTERDLVELDSSYYTASLDTLFDSQHLTLITLLNPLSYYKQGWEGDTVYVSLVSSVGPNTADIIQDIVTRYTPLSYDLASFAKVHNYLVNYPSNFAVFSTKDALAFIGEISWQARCAYDIVNNIVYLKYLSIEPAFDIAINDNDIQEASFEVGYTKVEDIVTQLVAQFKLNYSETAVQQNLIYNANQDIYGLRRTVYDWFIYTNASLVQKSLTFWGNRLSNQWKEINLKTFVRGLVCDIFDCVQMTIDGVTNKGIVDETEYDTLNHEVKFRFWTPLLAGTSTQSPLAWLTDTSDVIPPPPTEPQQNKGSILVSNIDSSKNDGVANTGNALLGIITGINTDGSFIADIYANGYSQPATENSVLVNLLDRRYRHKIGDRVLCVRIGNTYYDPSNLKSSVILAKVTAAQNDEDIYTIDVYRGNYRDGVLSVDQGLALQILDDQIVLTVDQEIAVIELVRDTGDIEYWLISSKSGGDLIVGGNNDTPVTDGTGADTDPKAYLSDVFTVKTGRLYLNIDSIGLTDNEGLVAELSDLLRIIGTDPCLWTNIKRTADGAVSAPEELTLDTDTFRPAATMLKD